MKKAYFLTFLLGLTTFCSSAQVLDQSNSFPGYPSISPSAGDTLAQSFKAGITGFLSNVEFRVRTDECSNLPFIPITAFVFKGDGPDSLMSTEFFELPNDMADTMYNFVFDNPVAIIADSHYTVAFHVEGVPTCNASGTTYLWFTYDQYDPYPNGSVYDMQTSTYNISSFDLSFNTYVSCAKFDSVAHPTCGAAADGTIDVEVTGSANYTYSWSNGSTSQDLSGLSAGTYTLTLTSDQGCNITDSVTLVDPYSDIVTTLETQTNNECFGDENGSIEVSVSGGEPGPGYTFQWDNGAGTSATAIDLAAGTYTLVVTDSVSCTDTVSYEITEPNQIDLSTTVNAVTIEANLSGATYQWLDCDDNYAEIAGATDSVFVASENGNYAVLITSDGCSDTSACVNIASVGILEIGEEISFNLYPNPTNQSITIDFGSNVQDASLRVTDLKGQTILQTKFNNQSQYTIDLHASAGMYMLTIVVDGQHKTLPIVKQ